MELENTIFNTLFKYTQGLSVALGYRDLSTRLHSERVRVLAEKIGKYCGLLIEELNALNIAASFHDIGKIGIPDHILLKPSKFEQAEWETMKQHADIGEKIMLSTELEGSQQAARLIRHHHEHFNGKGYPDKLSGEKIPICSRIISIADSYDAIAVTRAYHQSRTHKEVISILDTEAGTKHDPELVRVFKKIVESGEFRHLQGLPS